ncbi:MAG: hypothetical protein WBE97_07530 [Candidatus Acidiferrales bacterium]
MKALTDDWRLLAAAGAAVAVAIGAALYAAFRRRPDSDEIERRRRAHVNQIGRIAEGRVTELAEVPASAASNGRFGMFRGSEKNSAGHAGRVRKLLWYTYSISGVTYETAQDITGLEHRAAGPGQLLSGQMASVKYDPANPSNSILVSEDWSGLH